MARVLVPLAQGCEELEAVTIIDLLRRAGVEVVTAGLDDAPVRAAGGVVLVADTSLDQAWPGTYDAVVLPGGLPGADTLAKDERVQGVLKWMSAENRITAAICAAPRALAASGILESKRATCYPGSLEPKDVPSATLTGNAVEVDGTVTKRACP